MQRLKDVHIKKIALVARPAIRRGITLFKSEEARKESLRDIVSDALDSLPPERQQVLLEKLSTLPQHEFTFEERAEVLKSLAYGNGIAGRPVRKDAATWFAGKMRDEAWAKVNAEAEELWKRDPSLTREQARTKVMKSRPELYEVLALGETGAV